MLNPIDNLFHFTKDIKVLKEIFKHGFKPSYAKETLAENDIIVPMVSFSNILLRDTGEDQVLHYGDFAICLSRDWGIANEINPVVYTYDKGLLYNALNTFIQNSLLLSNLQEFKPSLKEFSDCKCGPFSKVIILSQIPKQVMDILDYLSNQYDESLVDILINHSKKIYDTNMPILTLTKQYKVLNNHGREFIAYNDREWRKLYTDLKIYFIGDEEYEKWNRTSKPHFNSDPYLLKFSIEDVKAILVQTAEHIDEMTKELKVIYGAEKIENQIASKSLLIGTKNMLEANNF
jgi:hypothetical protein